VDIPSRKKNNGTVGFNLVFKVIKVFLLINTTSPINHFVVNNSYSLIKMTRFSLCIRKVIQDIYIVINAIMYRFVSLKG